MLDRFADDERIFSVSGDNFQLGYYHPEHSYYFSQYVHVWGWATWRRAWQHYDVDMADWPRLRNADWLRTTLQSEPEVRCWRRIFDKVYAGQIDTWDHQLTFACWRRGAVNVLPSVNLVSNIGFGASATHTMSNDPFAALPVEAMSFPLDHPPEIRRDVVADGFTHRTMIDRTLWMKAARKLTGAFR